MSPFETNLSFPLPSEVEAWKRVHLGLRIIHIAAWSGAISASFSIPVFAAYFGLNDQQLTNFVMLANTGMLVTWTALIAGLALSCQAPREIPARRIASVVLVLALSCLGILWAIALPHVLPWTRTVPSGLADVMPLIFGVALWANLSVGTICWLLYLRGLAARFNFPEHVHRAQCNIAIVAIWASLAPVWFVLGPPAPQSLSWPQSVMVVTGILGFMHVFFVNMRLLNHVREMLRTHLRGMGRAAKPREEK